MTDRRALLQGGRYEIRPPWSNNQKLFFQNCIGCDGCDACITVCPTAIIGKDQFGYPLLDFSKGECLFCKKCLTACPTEALTATTHPWAHQAVIKDNCLSFHGTLCRLCGEECETNSIRFKPQTGGMAPPVITATCTGCGACVRTCPVRAIFIQ